jgi:hypothetical protein
MSTISVEPSTATIDLPAAKRFLSGMSPDLTWLLRQIESEDGFLRFPPLLFRAIANLKIENYPRLYGKEAAIGLIFVKGFLSDTEINELTTKLEGSSFEQRGEFLLALDESFEEQFSGVEIPKAPADEERARKQCEALSDDEKA